MAPLVLSPRPRSEVDDLAAHDPGAQAWCRAQALLWLGGGETPERGADALPVSRRTVAYRVARLDGRAGLDLRPRLADAPRPGRPRAAGAGLATWSAAVLATDPRQLGYHPTVWTAPVPVRHPGDQHRVEVSRQTVGRALARPGIRRKRPRHQRARRPAPWRQSKGG
jgi:hypothetical protein